MATRYAAVAALALLACTSARVTATLADEPVCSDFQVGAARALFKGALKKPVKITVLDGKTVISERVALGKRTAKDNPALLVVQDANASYTIRFAQCDNEFAPQRVSAGAEKSSEPEGRRRDDETSYDCGDAKTYQEIELKVQSGKPDTRVIPWQSPPDSACLASRVPEGAPASPEASSSGR